MKIWLGLNVKLGYIREKGWTGSLPIYAFKCQLHGLVQAYPSGWDQVLICPICLAIVLKEIGLV